MSEHDYFADIERLQKLKAKHDVELRAFAWDTASRHQVAPPDTKSVKLVSRMVNTWLIPKLLNNVLSAVSSRESRHESLVEFRRQWERRHTQDFEHKILLTTYDRVLGDVIEDMLRAIHRDLARMDNVATRVVTEMIMQAAERPRAVAKSSNPKERDALRSIAPRAVLEASLLELQRQRRVKAEAGLKPRFSHEYALKTIPPDPAAVERTALPASLQLRLASSAQLRASLAQASEGSFVTMAKEVRDEVALATVAKAPKRKGPPPVDPYSLKLFSGGAFEARTASFAVTEFEMEYLTALYYDASTVEGRGPNYTAVAASVSGKFVAMGNASGGLSVWRLPAAPTASIARGKTQTAAAAAATTLPVLERYVKESQSEGAVFTMAWMASDQHVATLDERGICYVWALNTFPNKGTGDLNDENDLPLPAACTHTIKNEHFFRTAHGKCVVPPRYVDSPDLKNILFEICFDCDCQLMLVLCLLTVVLLLAQAKDPHPPH